MSYKEDVYSLLEVKGVDISNFDLDILNMRIEGVFQSVIEYTNNDFTKNGELHMPYDIKNYIADVIAYEERPEIKNNIKSRTMGTVSYTFGDGGSVAFSDVLKKYRKAKFHPFY